MKRQVKLTESDLKQIVKESVNKILNEVKDTHQPSTEDNKFDIMPSGMYRGSYDSFRNNKEYRHEKFGELLGHLRLA